MQVSLLTETTEWGGAEKFTYVVAEALAQRGHSVTIVSFGDNLFEREHLPRGVLSLHVPCRTRIGLLSKPEQRSIVRQCPDGVGVFVKGWSLAGNWKFDLLARSKWERYYAVEQLECEPMPLRRVPSPPI